MVLDRLLRSRRGLMRGVALALLISACGTPTPSEQRSALGGPCVLDPQCSDGNPCTTDVCQEGTCQNDPVADCCRTNLECDDGDACTLDVCDPIAHTCSNPASGACDCRTDADCVDQ